MKGREGKDREGRERRGRASGRRILLQGLKGG